MIEMLNCDCMDFYRDCEDNAFSATITSPPYNMNLRVRNNEYCSREIVKELSTKYTNFSDNLSMEKYMEFTFRNIVELCRISELVFWNVQLVTGNKPAIFEAIGALSKYLKEVLIWDKCNAEPSISNGCLNSEFEFIFVFSKDDSKTRTFKNAQFKKGGLSNILRLPKNKSVSSEHKAGFPLTFPKWILSNFVRPGANVLDPFMGLGTTAIACHQMGFDFVGCELDKDYFEASQKRFKEETAQIGMF